MKTSFKILASSFIFLFFIILSISSGSGGSSSSTHTCKFCSKKFSGKGYTTLMKVVNKVDDENSPLNSYCSYKCASDCILTGCYSN